MLAKSYRFQVYNDCGQTLASGAVKVTLERYKMVDGVLTYDSEDETYTSGSTIADGVYDESTAEDNSGAANLFLGLNGHFEVLSPASADGPVVLFYQLSTDGGTTWPTDGDGTRIGTLNMGASETKRMPIYIA